MAKTILIVEDNALVLKVYNTALASVGANLLEARDGDEAMRLAAEYRPDLVIMDIMLPGVSGLDLTRRIKDDLPDTKVIAVTTLAMATGTPTKSSMKRSGRLNPAFLKSSSISCRSMSWFKPSR